MNLAVIGTGYWGKNHVRVFKGLLDEGVIDSLTICDADENRVKEYAQMYDIEYTTDYTELLASKIDAVSIATPSETHYQVASAFMANGKDVFIEKPMTLSAVDAEKLIEIAERERRLMMIGHIFRYHQGVRELKQRIGRGEFGKIYYMWTNRLSLRAPRADMGVLFALAIHEVDIYCYLLDVKYPNEIMATLGNYLGGVEETALLTLHFDEDVKGYAFESWLTSVYGKMRDMTVIGSKLSARVNYLKPQEIQLFDTTISKRSVVNEGSYPVPLAYEEPLRTELRHFVECLSNGAQPLCDMHAGKRAVEMIEAAMRSAETKEPVRFP